MITPGIAASLTPKSVERRERTRRARLHLPHVALHLPHVHLHLPHVHLPHVHLPHRHS